MNFHVTVASSNKKTGPMPVITASAETCPDACPLKGAGCYAEAGPLAIHWRRVTRGEVGTNLDAALEPIRRLPRGTVWRYGQAGDLPGVGNKIDPVGLQKIVDANRGKNGIVFTHKPPTEDNLTLVRNAAQQGLNINLSANSPENADELRQHGVPTVTVLPSVYARRRKGSEWDESQTEYKARLQELPKTTPDGQRIAVCPATYTDTTCQQCGVCSRPDRKGVVVGFPAHGSRRRMVDDNLK